MTQEKSGYDIQAEKFLDKTKTEFKTVFLKHDKYFDDDKETRDIYEITLKRGEREYKFKFGQSITNSGRYSIFTGNSVIKTNDNNERNRLKQKYSLGEGKINEEQEEPSPYDVLCCLTKYEPGTFENFCSDFGYDTDSRKAEKIYKSVVEEYNNLKVLYSDKELEEMSEIN